MLQIIIFLLCIYLVFKGKELLLLADLQPAETRERASKSAFNWFRASVIFAIIFALWAMLQGSTMPSSGM